MARRTTTDAFYGNDDRRALEVAYVKEKAIHLDRLFVLLVEHIGLEPMTSSLPVKRSSQLS